MSITNIIADNQNLTFDYKGTLLEAAVLRRTLMTEIPTYAIHIVIFDKNTSALVDELIALRLGLLIIDNEKLTDSQKKSRIHYEITGPLKFNSRHMKEIHFVHNTPIIELRENEQLIFDVIIEEGIGNSNVKWCPVSGVTFDEKDSIIKFKLENLGMLSHESLLQKMIEKQSVTSNRKPITIYQEIPK